MVHREHMEFTESTFRQLCERAGETLPESVRDSRTDWEERHIAVLEHLLAELRNFCGVEEGFSFENLTGYPLSVQVKQKIIGLVDFDSVHEHPTMVFFYKQPIIEEYVRKAIGEKPE